MEEQLVKTAEVEELHGTKISSSGSATSTRLTPPWTSSTPRTPRLRRNSTQQRAAARNQTKGGKRRGQEEEGYAGDGL